MIEIKCSKAQYERLMDAARSYYENDKCFLGKTFRSCPYIDSKEKSCPECLREHIKRICKEK